MQSFLDKQPIPEGMFETPLKFIPPKCAVVKSGSYASAIRNYKNRFKENRGSSIKIWTDFDLYHRNDKGNATAYKLKSARHPNIPDFHFSFHNFEDFLALHLEAGQFNEWLRIFTGNGHFNIPLYSTDYINGFRKIIPEYRKGDLPEDFVNQDSLKRLKHNKATRPTSNPQNLQGIGCFADFLINEIDKTYPDLLT